jgi:hypothetical protein
VDRRRLCEQRTIVTLAPSAEVAIRQLERRGREEQYTDDSGGRRVVFEYVGLRELIELDPGADADEVWWEFFEAVLPKENRGKWIPRKRELRAFRLDRKQQSRGPRRLAKNRRTR